MTTKPLQRLVQIDIQMSYKVNVTVVLKVTNIIKKQILKLDIK